MFLNLFRRCIDLFVKVINYLFFRFIIFFRHLSTSGKIDNFFDELFEKRMPLVLFITHSLGGGTRLYEKNSLKEYGDNVIVLRSYYESGLPDFAYILEQPSTDTRFYIDKKDLDRLFELIFEVIVVNSFIKYSKVFDIQKKICLYKEKKTNCRIRYNVHDYHCICRFENLFVDGRKYCNMDCKKYDCRLRLDAKRIDIGTWRREWFNFLNFVDEIICFSASSKEIILQAYPELDGNRIIIRPHSMDYCSFKRIEGLDSLELHLGIIGATSTPIKGKSVVESIIRDFGDDIPVSIIGESDKPAG